MNINEKLLHNILSYSSVVRRNYTTRLLIFVICFVSNNGSLTTLHLLLRIVTILSQTPETLVKSFVPSKLFHFSMFQSEPKNVGPPSHSNNDNCNDRNNNNSNNGNDNNNNNSSNDSSGKKFYCRYIWNVSPSKLFFHPILHPGELNFFVLFHPNDQCAPIQLSRLAMVTKDAIAAFFARGAMVKWLEWPLEV